MSKATCIIDQKIFTRALASRMCRILGEQILPEHLEPLGTRKARADATAKVLVRGRHRDKLVVILYASPPSSNLVARGLDRASCVRVALGDILGQVVLQPVEVGEIHEYTYAVFPYCTPVQNQGVRGVIERAWLRPKLLRWLRAATKATCTPVADADIEERFERPLKRLYEWDTLPDDLRATARSALDRLSIGAWRPSHVFTHFDLWHGNVLFAPAGSLRPHIWEGYRFVLIDWPGAIVNGYGIFDLLRIAMSFRLSSSQIRAEVGEHCETLGCSLFDAWSHLMCALGYLALNLECFPPSRFVNLASRCHERMAQSMKGVDI